MTKKELGQKIKIKFPVYKDLPDEDVAEKVIKKYPQYQKQITEKKDGLLKKAWGSPVFAFPRTAYEAGKETVKAGGRAIAGGVIRPVKQVQHMIPGGKTGDEPVKTPFGTINRKPTFGEHVDTFSFLPAKTLLSPVRRGFSIIKKGLPVDKIASFLTSEKSNVFRFAKDNKKLVREFMDVADDETLIPKAGEEIFNNAKKVNKLASNKWQKTESKILEQAKGKFQSGMKSLRDTTKTIFKKEGISVGGNKANLARSQFTKNQTAQKTFNRIVSIVNEKSNKLEHLLNKRSAIGNVIDEIPKELKNLRRVSSKVLNGFDDVLDDITGKQAGKLRAEYREMVKPARDIIKAMTNGKGELSQDKAALFIKQAISDIKFDKSKMVAELQKVLKAEGISKADFTKNIKGLGTARKLSHVAPHTSSRIKDVLFHMEFQGYRF